ncbi:LysE family translocator [Marinomonas spartinae]|uniref:LysE family translocator n=1 Tax=Marinomonas spartinae TaxID=1792290 RepID=UPI0018F16A4A|nr:LysE family translocator [Marinomonas spartinae]MBJ7554986.1 LysE family translocator [Marinomonas spartinae]
MLWSLLPSLCLFSFVAAVTPGPNNFLLASSGSQFGFRRTLGHVAGIRLGIIGLLLLSAIGIGALIERYPILHDGLKYIGIVYMSYLALKLVFKNSVLQQGNAHQPIHWRQAALFQMVNVKAWAASLSLVAIYSLVSDYWLSVLWIIMAFTGCGLIANFCWVGMGKAANRLFNTPSKIRLFNYGLSFLTIATIVPLLFEA